MRLLRRDNRSELSLIKHDTENLPPYAILSHTWGSDNDEVTFDDLKNGTGKDKAGYAKIMFCGEQALKDDLKDFWVDSCCIDKSSSAELSEALISMFRWYRQATKCYVYLNDVSVLKHQRDGQLCDWEDAFRKSRWFTRGWTLQELLAPRTVEFFSRDKRFVGSRESLANIVSDITGIPLSALRGSPLSEFSIPEKRRWAARRTTKKEEDKAYCLMGIFNVVIPPLYGEGQHAFVRLEREIDGPRSSPEPAQKGNRQEMLDSLKFDQLDARHSTIKVAQPTTCEWLLTHPDYLAWNVRDQVQHRRTLWIAGKPGTGKSTLMKFALAQAERSKHEHEIILSFFFNAGGHDLEKTTIGMYRALLLQLFEAVPSSQVVLDRLRISRSSAHINWTLSQLQELLVTAIKTVDAIKTVEQRQITCFIDALDECDEMEVRDMIEFFEDLRDEIGDKSRLYTCLASRHYPTIEIREGWRLVLEDQAGHTRDLEKYIQRRLKAGEGRSVDRIQAELQKKANGVFMWVVLVVEVLNQEFRRGRIFAVQQRLQEIPIGLSDLFRDLLRRDQVNMDDLLLCLQWLLFAKRPLSREEFYFAMDAGLQYSNHYGSHWKARSWDPAEVTIDDMDRFVSNASKGLVELSTFATKPTVRFIHESVRDFLLKDGGLQELWHDLGGNLTVLSHEKLKKCCLDYLDTADTSDWDLTQHTPEASSKLEKLREEVSARFPFLKYAAQNVLIHGNEAAHGVPQEHFVDTFPLKKWVCTANLYEQTKERRHSQGVNLNYVLGERDLWRLIMPSRNHETWIRLPEEEYQFAFLAAFVSGHRNALKLLLEDESTVCMDEIVKDPRFGKRSGQCSRDVDPLVWAAENGNWALTEYLLTFCTDKGVFSIEAQNREGSSVLPLAVECGEPIIVELLLSKGADVDGHGRRLSASSAYALERKSFIGRERAVQMLIDAGAKISPYGPLGNAFIEAAREGHDRAVQIIIDAGADITPTGRCGNVALVLAAFEGHAGVVRILLAAGAEVNAEGATFRIPLPQAASQGHAEIVQMLLDAGAQINSDNSHGNAFLAAMSGGHERVVQMLITAGANVNARGRVFQTALQRASGQGHDKVVQMLLDAGAEVNAQPEQRYGTALQTAALRGHEMVVKMLLQAGANVNARGEEFVNALQAAAFGGHETVVQILLGAGGEVNAPGGYHGTELQAAAWRGGARVLQMLLDAGANVNAQEEGRYTALYIAAYHGHAHLVRMLIDAGADVNALRKDDGTVVPIWHDRHGGWVTALQAAVDEGQEMIVQMLVEAGADVKTPEARSALQLAVKRGYKEIVCILRDAGAREEPELQQATP